MSQKILYILRHAKAETASSPSREDHERRLLPRGMKDANHMGKYLAAQGAKLDLVLRSTATRCEETWAALQMADVRCQISDKLYLASANELLKLLGEIPETVHAAMVIGHNPGLQELCLKLAKDGDNALRFRLSLKFPTCGLATLTFDAQWHDIARAQARLAGFVTPKML